MDADLPQEVKRGLELLEGIDSSAASAIEDRLVRLLRAGRATVWARQRLPALAAASSERERLQLLVDEAVALTEAPEAWAMTWSDGYRGSRVRALVGTGAGRTADGTWVVPAEISRSVLGRVAELGHAQWSDDARSDARFLGAASVQALELRSVGCVPIGTRGALYLHDPENPGRFGPAARAQVMALCVLVGAMLPPPEPEPTEAPGPTPIEGLVGSAPAMRELYASVRAFAPMPWPVLILGETGTGKEAVARAVHALSGREGPFVAVNAATLDRELAESHLFGHERGAFTGAVRARAGFVAEAGRGTLFLDEVGELPDAVQAKLLRLLQEGVYRRVGDDREHTFEGRIVAATHRAIDEAEDGFRADFYHRLSACVIRTPALRERLQDLPALVDHLLARAAAEAKVDPPQVAPDALAALRARSWPGNVRELLNVLRGALARVAARGEGPITLPDLPPSTSHGPGQDHVWPADLALATERFQQQRVRAALDAAGGNRTRAAEILGVSRQWLHRLISRWDSGGPW